MVGSTSRMATMKNPITRAMLRLDALWRRPINFQVQANPTNTTKVPMGTRVTANSAKSRVRICFGLDDRMI